MKHPRQAQRGAALLTALLIVSLVAALAAAMVWRQYRAVQVEAAERARSEADWILQGALDWARLILREDARANQSKPVDHLGEVWAVPLAEARLSTFLAQGQGSESTADAGPEAFLSGTISDAQALYNLRNLIGGTAVPAQELKTLEQLCTYAGLPVDTATLIATRLRAAYATPPDPATAPLQPVDVDQLAWFGLPADAVERLRSFVTLLPVATPVNLNTAPREVIAALLNIDLASAERLVQVRRGAPLQSVPAAVGLLPQGVQLDLARASVMSSYFFVTGRLRLDERVLTQRSLVQRAYPSIVTVSRRIVSEQALTGSGNPG